MSFLEVVKNLLGIKPVDIGDLNRRATRETEHPKPKAPQENPLEGIVITEEFEKVRKLLEEGCPEEGCPVVFVTGNAGTGKSTLIHYLRATLDRRLAVLAPTGVAALNVGGVTAHSFFHFPPKILEEEDIKRVADRKLYEKLEVLIIDEVSMVRCDLMDSIDKFLRKNRSDDKPFGGVKLLLVGDLFQLPPVAQKREWDVLRLKGYASPHFFSAFSLQGTSLVPVELMSVYRQEDSSFVDLLNRVRVADDLDRVIDEANRKCSKREGFRADITLTCTNSDADQINTDELDRLSSKEHLFKGKLEGHFHIGEDKLPSPMNLRLKVGARVMFTKNDEQRRWVNGTLGVVREMSRKNIRVELVGDSGGTVCDVLPVSWESYKYVYDPEQDRIVSHKIGQYTQYPLMLAWAVTIHKSQGKTLNNVLVDLGHGAFASGQVYVALSRCRSIEGISLARLIRKTDVKCDPMIKRFYLALEEMKKNT